MARSRAHLSSLKERRLATSPTITIALLSSSHGIVVITFALLDKTVISLKSSFCRLLFFVFHFYIPYYTLPLYSMQQSIRLIQLGLVYTSDGSDGSEVVNGVRIGRKF